MAKPPVRRASAWITLAIAVAWTSGALILGQSPALPIPSPPSTHALQDLGLPRETATADRPGLDVQTWAAQFSTLANREFRGVRPGVDLVLRGTPGVFDALVAIDPDVIPSSLVFDAGTVLQLSADGVASGVIGGQPLRISARFFRGTAAALTQVPGGLLVSGRSLTLWADPSTRSAGSGEAGVTAREPIVAIFTVRIGEMPAAAADASFGAVTLTWQLQTDVDASGGVSPGDRLRYVLTIPNSGDAAMTNVVTTLPLDPNTTLVGGSRNTSPIALDQGPTVNEDAALPVTLTGSDVEGQALTFTVVSAPANGTFTQASTGSAGGTYTPAANFFGTDTFTFRVNDGLVNSNEVATVTITVNPVNDIPSFTKGPDITVSENAGAQNIGPWATNLSEGPANEVAQTLTFEVTGNSNPALFADGPHVAPNLGSLLFTPAPDAFGTATITLRMRDSGGTANGGIDVTPTQTFTITVSPINSVPSFTKGADQTVLEDAGAQSVSGWATAISAGPGETQGLTFEITANSNPALFSAVPAVAASGTLTFTPAANMNGTANITLRLKDDGGTANGGVDTSATQTFAITVTAVNDAPSFAKGADVTVLEDSGAHTTAGWATALSAGPTDESGQTLAFNITGNTNAALFASGPSIASNGTLTFTPAANRFGTATISVTISDSGGTANSGADTSAVQTFDVIITNVNDAPSFTKGADQTVLEDAGAQSVSAWATGISAGPFETDGLTFEVTGNTNPALFAAAPTVSPTGTLAYTPAANANGSATITLRITDNGGVANSGVDASATQTFGISVTAVNDAPSFTKGANQTVLEDSGAFSLSSWATAISRGPADESAQTLTFNITGNSNPALFAAPPAIAANGTLTFTPAINAFGTATISVTLSDNGGTANSGADTSAAQTFDVTVTPVNDVPSFTKGGDQTVLEDAAAQSVANWATAISAGPNESGQAITFVVTANSNSALFAAGPAVAANGTLTFTPAANANGTATITLRVTDDGGTADGGVDASATQSFDITVTAVNDAPSFTKGANQTVLEDSGAFSLSSWATGIAAGPSDESGQTLTFNVTGNSNAALFSVQPAISATGTLTFTTAANRFGTATVTITLSDNGGTANSGADTSASQSFDVILTNVNDAPSFTKGADETRNEDAGAISVSSWATSISPGPFESDTVAFEITGNTNPGLFSALPAVAANGTLTFTSGPNANGSATITLRITDNGGTANSGVNVSATQSFLITVNPINDAPVLGAGGTLVYVEGDGAQQLTSSLTVLDVDSVSFTGAVVQITENYVEGQDVLAFTNTATITGVWDPATGTLTLSGSDTLSNYQAALRSITYTNTSNAPSVLARTVTFTATDGVATSNAATRTIAVTAVNTVPVVVAGGTLAYAENDPAAVIRGALTVTDPDSSITGGSVRITGNYANGQDVLAFTDTTNISGSWNATNGTLTLSGTDTPANYQAALRTVTYVNTSDDPSTAARTVTFLVNDGVIDSDPVTTAITVAAVNDAPNVTAGNTLAFTENDPASPIEPAFGLTDPDSANITSASVQITANYQNGQDLLSFSNTATITGLFTPATGLLTLTGTDTVANYRAALRTVSYQNTSESPATAARTVTWSVTDGTTPSTDRTSTINVTAVNDLPLLTAGATLTYTENDGPTVIDSTVTLTDADHDNMTGATVTISGNFQTGQDVLSFTNANGISGSWDGGTGVLTLSGSASKANYQTALRSVQYSNSSNDPATAARTITWSVTDGTDPSAGVTSTVNITAVNDAPAIVTGAALAYTENGAPAAVQSGLTITDPDTANLASATVQITGNYASGQDTLAFTDANGITGNWNATNGTLTLTGPASVANFQTALRSITYVNGSESPSPLARTVTWQANDGTTAGNAATSTINVTSVNDIPVLTAGATLAYTEGNAATPIDATITVADLDNTNLASATIQITGNFLGTEDVLAFVDSGSITGAWNSTNGTLTLTGAATLADYQAALRTVTYQNTSTTPSTAARTVTWIGNDGTSPSAGVTSTINVTSLNDPAVVTAGGTLAFTEGNGATAIAPALTVTDDGTNLVGATVQITGNFVSAQDVLAFSNTASISGSFNATNGTLTLTGTDTVANYQAALRAVTYANASQNPTTTTRTVTFIADDGEDPSSGATRSITVAAVNDAPSVPNKSLSAQTNMPISFNAAAGLLSGVTDADHGVNGCSTTLTVTNISATSPANGSVSLDNADGSFTFTPPPGVTGDVSFTYQVQDNGCPGGGVTSSAATVTFTVSGPVIWFVNASAGAGGNGTLGAPFNTLAAADAVDAANHRVYLYNGTYATGLTLQSGEWLVSQGAHFVGSGMSFDSFMGISPPTGTMARPAGGSAGSMATVQGTVAMATNSVLNGIAISTAGNGFVASSTTGFTVANSSVSSSSGTAVTVTSATPSGTAAFASVSASGTAAGISMSNAGGTWSFAGGSLAGSALPFNISGGTPTVSYSGTITPQSTAAVRPINIINLTSAGSVTFTGAVSAGGSNLGILLDNNDGATITFRGGVALSLTNQNAFTVTNGAAGVNVCNLALCSSGGSVNNTLTTTTGTPLTITNSNIGSSGVTFRSITANGAPSGIVLSATGSSGGLTVTGDGASNTGNTTRGRTTSGASGTLVLASGGTITNSSGDAVSLANTNNVVLRNMTITGGSNDGIDAGTVTNLTIDNSRITGKAGGHGIRATTVSGLAIIHSEVESNATTAGVESSDIWNAKFTNLTGTNTLQHSLFRDTREVVFGTINDAANTLALTVTNCRFADANTPGVGLAGLRLDASSTANVSATVTSSEFSTIATSGFQYVGSASSGGGTVSVSGSTFDQNVNDIDMLHNGLSKTVTFAVSNNTMRQTFRSGAGNSVNLAVGSSANAGTTLRGTISGNTIGAAGVTSSGGSRGIRLFHTTVGSLIASVTNNVIRQATVEAIFVNGGTGHTGRMDVTFSGNDVSANTASTDAHGLLVDAATDPTTTGGVRGIVCLNFGANTAFIGHPGGVGIGVVAAFGTVELQGYAGAQNDDAALMTFLNGRATTVNPGSAVVYDVGVPGTTGIIRSSTGSCITP